MSYDILAGVDKERLDYLEKRMQNNQLTKKEERELMRYFVIIAHNTEDFMKYVCNELIPIAIKKTCDLLMLAIIQD